MSDISRGKTVKLAERKSRIYGVYGLGGGDPFFVCVRVFLPFSFPLEDCFALNLPSFRIICSRLKLKLNISFCRALDLLANEI